MRIAIIAPLFEHIPPRKYGGTERVVHFMVEELVRMGHTVTLYATRGSETSAELIECAPEAFRDAGIGNHDKECEQAYTDQLQRAFSEVQQYDVIHVHHGTHQFHPAIIEAIRTMPLVWTDHNAVDNDGKPEIFNLMAKRGIGLTALSDSHRSTLPDANWLATIHHGLPPNLLTPSEVCPTYLAFLGRISPEKGITSAVRISEGAGFELKVAAKVDDVDRKFYEDEVAPLFAQSDVDFIGEVSEKEKGPFLSAAIALIFPICWKEPFGLVMIEAMACGCPVIAFRMGSVPEIVEDGVTGFVVDTEAEAIEALHRIGTLSRKKVRQRFEERFTSPIMAQKYVDLYERIVWQNRAIQEAQNITKTDTLQSTDEDSVVTGPTVAIRQRPRIYAAFQRTLST